MFTCFLSSIRWYFCFFVVAFRPYYTHTYIHYSLDCSALPTSKVYVWVHLPGQRATQEVHEDKTERLNVVSSTLFDSQVRIDRSVTCCAGQILPLCMYLCKVCILVRRWYVLRSHCRHYVCMYVCMYVEIAGVGYLQIWNMSSVSWVLVLLRQTEVDYVAHVL